MINIYVGNLPYGTSADELAELFSRFGTVIKSAIVFDRETGRSRGFGFVEMEDREAGLRGIEELSTQSFKDRPLTINEARPRGSVRKGNYASAAATSSGEPVSQSGGYKRYIGAPSTPSDSPKPAPTASETSTDADQQPSGYSSGYRRASD